jgi:hypothetical protein
MSATNHTDAQFHEYENYLKAIFRPGDTLCFLGIDHKTDDREQDFVSYEKAVSREYFDELSKSNEVGSIYVATNTFPASLIGQKAGRTQENVVAVRALQADADNNGAATADAIQHSALVPPPSIIVESSPNKRQAIWLVDDILKEDAKPLMQAIASTFGTDSAVAEVARVMRVPGFVNRKYDAAPVARTLSQTNTRYRREDFKVYAEVTKFEQRTAPEEYLNAPFIAQGGQYGGIYNHVLKIVGHYVAKIKDGDVMFDIVKGCKERNGCFYADGVTAYEWDEEKVRQQCLKQVDEWKDKPGPLTLSGLQSQATVAATQQNIDVSQWPSLFRSIGEMEDGPIDMIIEGALQEGTCFIGANPSDGKTLVSLAFAKAICTGTPLFGLSQFRVPKPRPVIYLIPESRDRAFRKRCTSFRMPDDKTKFMTRTISAGPSLDLQDPMLLEAVRQTKPVLFLDTASRFMKGNDENAAAQNRLLVNDVIGLLAAGAVAVVLVHHATKSAKQNQEKMTLENMLRGTGDFGAMCDQAYGIRKDMTLYANGAGPMEIDLVSLKDREQIGGLTSIRLAASHKPAKRMYREDGSIHESSITFPISYIDETGNFHAISQNETGRRESQLILGMVKQDPNIPSKDIAGQLGITDYRVKTTLEQNGYHRVKGGPTGASPWHKDDNGVCPYDKVVEVKPSKKTLDTTVTEVVKDLRELLANSTGGFIPETDVLAWADKQGVTEPVLNKAKRRLGIVKGKDGQIVTWALPGLPEPVMEPF